MAELDQASRFAIKRTPTDVRHWLLPLFDHDFEFVRMLDTRMIAFPGEPKRRCDTVAEFVSRSGTQPPWAIIFEVEARPRAPILDRLLEYKCRVVRKLRHGPHLRDRYRVAALVLFLSGTMRELKIDMWMAGEEIGLVGVMKSIELSTMSAAETLARIARGELGRGILFWIALMSGAGDAGVVAEWLRLASEEPDADRRSEYGGIALIFANWAGHGTIWQKALEGWNVEKIEIVERWKAEARTEGRREGHREGALQTARANLLKLLGFRFTSELPTALTELIKKQADPDRLSAWYDAALAAASLEAFQQGITTSQIQPGNGVSAT